MSESNIKVVRENCDELVTVLSIARSRHTQQPNHSLSALSDLKKRVCSLWYSQSISEPPQRRNLGTRTKVTIILVGESLKKKVRIIVLAKLYKDPV